MIRCIAVAAGSLVAMPVLAEAPKPPTEGHAASSASSISDAEQRKRAAELIRQMLPAEAVAALEARPSKTAFAGEFAHMIHESAFVSLWPRPGLSPRDRSILTIGMLIAEGSRDELKAHFANGVRNGLTRTEIEEILYHSMAYVGIPKAAAAVTVARSVVEPSQ